MHLTTRRADLLSYSIMFQGQEFSEYMKTKQFASPFWGTEIRFLQQLVLSPKCMNELPHMQLGLH